MGQRRKRALSFAMIAVLVFTVSGFQAMAEEQMPMEMEKATGEAMAADLVLLRPLGIAATALGTVLFVASLPFSATGGNAKGAFNKLVGEPGGFTFARPLGKIEY
jgi:hypothetical protein